MSKLKKQTIRPTKITLNVRCGECVHFKTGPGHPAYDNKLCSTNGITAFAQPCVNYYPDFTKLRTLSETATTMVRDLMSNITTQQARILSLLVAKKETLDKSGYKFGQSVAFSIGGRFLCNYVRGYVIGCDREGKQIYLTSSMEKLNRGKNAFISIAARDLLNSEEYRKLRAKLIVEGKIIEPRVGSKLTLFQQLTLTVKERKERERLMDTDANNYVPPTIDTVPTSWLDKRRVKSIVPEIKITPKGSVKIKR